MSHQEPATSNQQRFTSRDWRLIALCLVLAAVSVAVVARYFSSAFPEASIDFRFDRDTSRAIAVQTLGAQGVSVVGLEHAVRFDSDDTARVFLERSLGLDRAKHVLRNDVRVWTWHHRWFQPLREEEFSVDVAPTGEIVGYRHILPEDRPAPGVRPPLPFLRSVGVRTEDLVLVSTSERMLPQRIQRIYTYESKSVRPAGAPYRHVVTIDGPIVTSYTQGVKVPDAWLRSYRELRSKNSAAGQVDQIFMAALMLGVLVVFVIRLRRGDLPIKFLLLIGAASVLLVGAVTLNSIPSQIAYYETSTSYPAFLGNLIFWGVMQSVGTAMLLIVICGAGEVLYRERLPRQLAIPRLWNRKSLQSKRVFLSLILGYALVPMFIAYQVVFYLVAQRYGAWSPAEVPYDDTLNTAIPWVTVLFAGFFPAFSEEFLSRAFAIPFLQRFVRSRWFAIILAGFIWGFGHAGYPQQPFWIRGVEVGIAGVIAGLLFDRVGLLPLLIWHYTIDAVYTATLLFASGNTYYVVSAAISSLIFAVPLVASIALYVRNRGFVPDEELSNATIPVHPPEPNVETGFSPSADTDGLKPVPTLTRTRVLVCIALVAIAALAVAFKPASPSDAIDYRISKERAKEIARRHVRRPFEHVIAVPTEGFRSWDESDGREEGGAPGGFDDIAATYLVQQGTSIAGLADIFRHRIEAGTWTVRFFTPLQKEEIYVEVDPRTERVVGYHKYQDEEVAGPALVQPQAQAIALRAFRPFGLEPGAFELKEALTFVQPRRRDWLFHFDERTPLGPRASRRVTVRVAGAEVTQFNKTIKVPDIVYREATTKTLMNVILLVMKIIGMVALLSLVIAGLVIATRKHGLPWKRALRWTLVLSAIPLLNIAARYEMLLAGYSTSVAWETFRVSVLTSVVMQFGLQIGLLFLAIAGLEAAMPHVPGLIQREGRGRYGRAAVVAAITAIALLVIMDVGARFAAHAVPAAAVVGISVPSEVAVPFPGIIEALRGIPMAIILSAAVALLALTLRRYRAAFIIIAVFCATLDPSATPSQAPMMLAGAAVLAVLAWIIARYVLNGNPLAWPLFVFIGSALQTASTLLQNQRPDLTANAIALFVFALLAAAWAWRGPARRTAPTMSPRS
ncbi:MAG TPA: CPBP family intramembrane glutamic endopeptidase [Thermoanaerobaculia bacterium]|nr:CPBP family intramembrane glutamic endopeptidase [Thermoanaerobaculia bacterium]